MNKKVNMAKNATIGAAAVAGSITSPGYFDRQDMNNTRKVLTHQQASAAARAHRTATTVKGRGSNPPTGR